jgi:hypothetical protein
MPAAVLSSISPVSGAPGTVITLTGSGFDTTAQVGCPVLVATTNTSSTSISAAIPPDMEGPEGGSVLIAIYVVNADGSVSNQLTFTVQFPAVDLQTYTSIDLVCGEVPGFQRGFAITDANILAWMKSIAQTTAGVLLRRGLPLDPSQWQQATATTAFPTAAGVLEQIVRLGAAARLAAAVAAQSMGGGADWGFSKNLSSAYQTEMKLLTEGEYDKLFLPSASTVEAGQLVAPGELATNRGWDGQIFRKEKVF